MATVRKVVLPGIVLLLLIAAFAHSRPSLPVHPTISDEVIGFLAAQQEFMRIVHPQIEAARRRQEAREAREVR